MAGTQAAFPVQSFPSSTIAPSITAAEVGTVLDWEVGQWHGFIALEPNTRLVNIVKG